MNKKEIVFNYLNKKYKDVSIENIIDVGNDMFSYVDKHKNKHIIRVVRTKDFYNRDKYSEIKVVKYDDNYSLEIVTRKNI